MNKLKYILNKELLYYILVHFFCASFGTEMLSFITICILEEYNSVVYKYSDYISLFFLILIILFKIFGLIIYYQFSNKRVQNPLITKLFIWLKKDNNYARLLFMFMITMFYNIATLFHMITEYNWLEQFFEYTCYMYLFSSLFSYKLLFTFWDVYYFKLEYSPNKYELLKFVFDKLKLFMFIMIFIISAAYMILRQRTPCT